MNTLSDEQIREALRENSRRIGHFGGTNWAKRQAEKGWDEVTKRLHEGRKKALQQKKKGKEIEE